VGTLGSDLAAPRGASCGGTGGGIDADARAGAGASDGDGDGDGDGGEASVAPSAAGYGVIGPLSVIAGVSATCWRAASATSSA
jgi:hypothetical protein